MTPPSPSLYNRLSASSAGRPLHAHIAVDIATLMNCATRGMALPLAGHAHAARSVYNLGRPALSPTGASLVDPHSLAAGIHARLLDFEPRFKPGSLRVEARGDSDLTTRRHLYFDISARLVHDDSEFRMRLALDHVGSSFSAEE